MKATFTIIFLLIANICVINAQSISNGNFEDWISSSFGFFTFEVPTNWGTCNDEAAMVGVTPVQKVTGNNNFGVLLESKSTLYGVDIAGIIANGEYGLVISATPKEVIKGVPFTSRPNSISFNYKYEPSAGDNCYGEVVLFKNGTEVGKGTFTQSNTVSSWTSGSIAINYTSVETPDTLLILFQSSKERIASSGLSGSKLYLDDISLEGLSVEKFSESEKIKIYPLPAKTEFYVALKTPVDAKIQLSNLVGQTIFNKSVKNMSIEKIDVSNLNKGIYILTLHYANQSFSRRITIQ